MDVFVTALNRRPKQFSDATGVPFPKHLTIATCRYLIVGEGYFGFRDRDDLKKKCKRYLGENHAFLGALNGDGPATAFAVIADVRNFGAHQGEWAKSKLKKTLRERKLPGADGISTAGTYLAAVDNSLPWRTAFGVPSGRTRIDAFLTFLSSIGAAVKQHVNF
jgi:hypothetical protein